jgi:hypothetical protein
MATLLYFTSYKSISYSDLVPQPTEPTLHLLDINFRSHHDAPGSLYTDQGGIGSLRDSIRLVSPGLVFTSSLYFPISFSAISYILSRADDIVS